jgi:valacyclovir hydrolase
MPFISLPTGATLYYDDLGEGTPFLVVHGWMGTGRFDLGNVLDWLSPDYRVIAPTMRGYGESFPKPRDYPLDHYQRDARDLLAFMDALDISKAHLLGYSDGGEVALLMAGMQPERFYSVMTIGSVGYYGEDMRPALQNMYPADYITEEDKARNGITDVNAFALGWINAAKHIVDSGGDLSLSLAPNITTPLLLMLGTQDTLNPEAYGQRFVDAAPNGRLVMFECGHPIHQQQEEQFKRVVGAFLAENRHRGG